ncbi:MAG TPA: cysteine methyltransferase, partial [Bacteroidales bacterium]|nr:cysteine methyltransferase [Bacteroidales bacterium]
MKTEDSFFQKVYDITSKIPYGKVTSYGAIARYLSTSGSA